MQSRAGWRWVICPNRSLGTNAGRLRPAESCVGAKRRPGGPTTRVPESEWEEERCGGRGLRTFRRAFPAASDLERNSGALSGWMAATMRDASVLLCIQVSLPPGLWVRTQALPEGRCLRKSAPPNMQRLLASKKTVGRPAVGKPPKLKVTCGVKLFQTRISRSY